MISNLKNTKKCKVKHKNGNAKSPKNDYRTSSTLNDEVNKND